MKKKVKLQVKKFLIFKRVDIFRNTKTTDRWKKWRVLGGRKLSLCPVKHLVPAGLPGGARNALTLEAQAIFGGSFKQIRAV